MEENTNLTRVTIPMHGVITRKRELMSIYRNTKGRGIFASFAGVSVNPKILKVPL